MHRVTENIPKIFQRYFHDIIRCTIIDYSSLLFVFVRHFCDISEILRNDITFSLRLMGKSGNIFLSSSKGQ